MILHTDDAREVVKFIKNHNPTKVEKYVCYKCLDSIKWYDEDGSSPDIEFYSDLLTYIAFERLDDYDNPPDDWPECMALL